MAENWLASKREWLLGLLIFVLPINLFKSFSNSEEYLSGLRIDYLIPKLYVSDILLMVLLGSLLLPIILREGSKRIKITLTTLVALTLGAILVITQMSSPLPLIGVLSLLKVVGAIVLMILVGKIKVITNRNIVMLSMSFALIWQSLLSIYQWIFQHPFLPYVLSGESRLESTLFSAKSMFIQPGHILPYGSTAHPNILAGFAALYGLGMWAYWLQSNRRSRLTTTLTFSGLAASLTILALTESFSAVITFFSGSYLLSLPAINRKKIHSYNWFSLATILMIVFTVGLFAASSRWPDNTSISRRTELLLAAAQIGSVEPLIGIGGGQFTVALNWMGLDRKLAPFIQPVHNVPILFFCEYGLAGAFLLIIMGRRYPYGWFAKKLSISLLAIVPLLALDHYLITLTPGLYLFVLVPTLWHIPELKLG